MYRLYITTLFILTIQSLAAQQALTGKVIDTETNQPVSNAVVAIFNQGDSTLVNFSRTNTQGNFSLKKATAKNYILMVMHPTYGDYIDNINTKNASLGNLKLIPKSKLLQEVILRSGGAIRIKGDTTIYTADSFKVSANANVEELLKKLPGIQVDKSGTIKAMGQTVEKVLVDGEEFFGDDPGMAVKNLRADAVKEVQVFDKKSEEAAFTGIDDGKSKKTINLKLKEDKKRGYFGKVALAGGLKNEIDDRYNNNLMFSSFKGKRKISAFFLNGNTGQDGLNWRDNEKFGGGNDNMSMSLDDANGFMMYNWRGGSTDEEPTINTNDGFITNVNAGLQYSNKWNDKHSLNYSPKYNSQDWRNTKDRFVQTFVGNSTDNYLLENTSSNNHVNRFNIKNNLVYDVTLDSNNSIKFTGGFNVYRTKSEDYISTSTATDKGILLNNGLTINNNEYDKRSYSANMVIKHKFKKARRTFSLTTDWKSLNMDANNFQYQNNNFIGSSVSEVIDQNRKADKFTNTITTKGIFTEPLSKKYSLELSHEFSLTNGNNNQTTYSYSTATGKYDQLVDSLTNFFDQRITVNKPGMKISYQSKKLRFNLGSEFAITKFNFSDVTENKTYNRNFTNIFPSASLNYSYKSNHNFRFSYNGSTTQPTLNQLQPLRNINNRFNEYIGNPALKQTFNHNINFLHNSYDFLKEMWTYQSVNINFTNDAITNNRVVDIATGKTTTQPINTNGNVNITFFGGVGFPIKKAGIRFSINPNITFSKFADVINSQVNFTRNVNAGISFSAEKSKDKKYEFVLSGDYKLNRNKNSLSNTITRFTMGTFGFTSTVYIKKVWSVSSDVEYNYRQRTTQFGGNLNNTLWNARFQKTFRNDEFTLYVRIQDILNENIGVNRDFFSNTFTEERNLRLRQFWMLGLTWNFKNKLPKTK